MRVRVLLGSLLLVLVIMVGLLVLSVESNNELTVEDYFSSDEQAWILEHEGEVIYYSLEDVNDDLLGSIINTMSLITKFTFIERPADSENLQLAFGVSSEKINQSLQYDGNRIGIDIMSDDKYMYGVLNKTIDYINEHDIVVNFYHEQLLKGLELDFQQSLTKEERAWLDTKESIVVGLSTYEPVLIQKDEELYGSIVGVLNLFTDMTGKKVKYITGEEDKLLKEKNTLRLDAYWSYGYVGQVSSESFVSDEFVAVGLGSYPFIDTVDGLNGYKVGITMDDFSKLSGEIVLDNLQLFDDYQSGIASLMADEVDFFLMPANTLVYYEDILHYNELDMRIATRMMNHEYITLYDDELKSIMDKVIKVSKNTGLEISSINDIPVEESLDIGRVHLILIICGLMVLIVGIFAYRYRAVKKSDRQVEYVFNHDQLTHLPNKYGIQKYIEKEIDGQVSFQMILIVINDFQRLLDQLGHYRSDQLIIKYSQTLLEVMNHDIVLSRSGNSEFIIVSKQESILSGDDIASKIEELTNVFSHKNSNLYTFTVNISHVSCPKYGKNYEELYRILEYSQDNHDKDIGNCFIKVDDIAYAKYLKDVKLSQDLKQGLKNEDLQLFIQPQFLGKDKKICGGEFLIRWIHPELGMINPGVFLPLFKKHGMIRELDYYVVRKAFRQIKKWQNNAKGMSDFTDRVNKLKVSINLTSITFDDKELIENLESILDEVKLDPSWITLEVTEENSFKEFKYTQTIFREIKALGFNISLDDFGKGYSSLSYINQLAFDEIKIDKSFVDEIHTNSQQRKLYEIIVDIAVSLGLEYVVEGIEHKEQADIIEENGQALLQGYYYAKPMPLDEFDALLKKQGVY